MQLRRAKGSIPGGFWPGAVRRENAAWPAVVYERSSTDHATGISGGGGFATATFSLDIWSPDYGDCVTTAECIRLALQGFNGWWSNIGVISVWVQDDGDSVERPADGSGGWWYSRSLDVAITFAESVPRF